MNRTKLSYEDRLFVESIIRKSLRYSEVWIDFFCGFGGVTHGIERTKVVASGVATVIACLNHDENAIGSHKLANPFCYHITEDIRTAYTDVLKYMVREIRRRSNGRIKVKLWFSHECTHYSIAKGGDSRDADSRSLPEELHRYIDELNPDAVWIENVREFLSWGPLMHKEDEFGRPMYKYNKETGEDEPWMVPIPERKGEYFDKWRDDIIAKGFTYGYKILNCADYGCPTIRKRVFIQFLKGEKVVWAKPTHNKEGIDGLKPWIPIKACLDRTDQGESIFKFTMKPIKKKVRVPGKNGKLKNSYVIIGQKMVRRIESRKTYKRLYEGCIKILEPEFMKAAKEPQMVTIYYGNGMNNSVDDPANTLTTKDRISLVSTEQFISQYFGSGGSAERNRKVEDPSAALTTNPRARVVSAQFVSRYYSGEGQNQSIDVPGGTITTVPHERLVSAQFMDDYHGVSVPKSLDDPSLTLTTTPKQALVSADMLMNTNYDNPPTSTDEPSPTITANRKWLYLINMQFSNKGHSIDVPSPTLVAKMDKKPNYLITLEDGTVAIAVYEDDYPEVIMIKAFMAKWGISDIYMRELRIPEMLRIHTMPDDLPMVGSITERKKFIGNQVPAQIVTELILGSYYGNYEN